MVKLTPAMRKYDLCTLDWEFVGLPILDFKWYVDTCIFDGYEDDELAQCLREQLWAVREGLAD